MTRVRSAVKNSNEIEPLSQSLSQSQPRKKASKGTVVVQVFKGRLRLCWSYLGKRYFLYIGLPDSKLNRTIAESKAKIIEADLATSNFDPTLKKYKTEVQLLQDRLSVPELFHKFGCDRFRYIKGRSQEKYRWAQQDLQEFFGTKPAEFVGESSAWQFTDWLKTKVSPLTLKQRLSLIQGCWIWALEHHLVETNPWKQVAKQTKVPPQQMPKPFSREEIGAIVQAFRTDCYYSHYADFVEFLFGTGCRTGEAVGLKWRHVSDDCSTVWIGESISRGVKKATKTNRARTISLTPKLQAMLLSRRPVKPTPDSLVFTAPKGGAIDDHNFRNRAWKNVLTRLEIDYRKPYATRSTLISHALDLGMNPVTVAQLTGHDVETLYEHYAGNVNSRPRLPEI